MVSFDRRRDRKRRVTTPPAGNLEGLDPWSLEAGVAERITDDLCTASLTVRAGHAAADVGEILEDGPAEGTRLCVTDDFPREVDHTYA